MKVVLASQSPRRIELLCQVLRDFEVAPADVEEEELPNESPWQTAERLAFAKATKVHMKFPEALVIGGDTVVAVPEDDVPYTSDTQRDAKYTQLAKPLDDSDAVRMLHRLSGTWHLVISGLALVGSDYGSTASETTMVAFRQLRGDEIQAYVSSGEPSDKAGAFAIQGGASAFVERVEGSRTNVIGLPLELLRRELEVASEMLPGLRDLLIAGH
jgi:septum formation protein